jgi:C1A family cysteine protease
MKYLLLAALVALLAIATVSATKKNYVAMFEDFKVKYQRKYASHAEESQRLRMFVENMKKAEKLQASNPHATFGVNEFADMSAADFKIRHSAEKHYKSKAAHSKPVSNMFTEAQVKSAASKIDWRSKGAVTAVKNQGQCGSCWSFSSTGSIEGQWFLAGHTLVSVSEQELVSCDTTDDGCNGGLMDNAWSWLVSSENGNIATEGSYPYVSGDGVVPACSGTGTTGATISGHQDLPKSESQMTTWMSSNGPISIGVDATSWQTYISGIMTNCISSQVDHGVLAVGFDLSNSPPYWIIKNSWGASWGENGYLRVQYGTDQCLITDSPCSSTVSGGPNPPGPSPPGPSPPGPSPPGPSPPGPSPPGPGGDFTQYVCDDLFCLTGCQGNTFQQNTCLQLTGGGSAVVVCTGSGLQITSYTSSDCSGSGSTSVEPVDQCLADTSGTYVYNSCGGSSSSGTQPSSSAASSSSGFDQPKVSFQLPKALQAKHNALMAKKAQH